MDGTHYNNYGSYELAKRLVAGIKQNQLDLAQFLVDDVLPFGPGTLIPLKVSKCRRSAEDDLSTRGELKRQRQMLMGQQFRPRIRPSPEGYSKYPILPGWDTSGFRDIPTREGSDW